MIPFGTSSIALKALDAAAMGCMVTTTPQVTTEHSRTHSRIIFFMIHQQNTLHPPHPTPQHIRYHLKYILFLFPPTLPLTHPSTNPLLPEQTGTIGTSASPSSNAEPEMPFLKKWVRTRHAILFRLSNRTVQVLFFDRSEVLLSSEARMVTYVNKQGIEEISTLSSHSELPLSPFCFFPPSPLST